MGMPAKDEEERSLLLRSKVVWICLDGLSAVIDAGDEVSEDEMALSSIGEKR